MGRHAFTGIPHLNFGGAFHVPKVAVWGGLFCWAGTVITI